MNSKKINNWHIPINPNSKISDRRLYLSIEHDAALLCWLKEKRRLNIDNFLLLTIDNHIDLTSLENDIKQRLKVYRENLNSFNLSELKDLMKTEFHNHSVSFIVSAMELGLVKNAIIFSPNKSRYQYEENEEEENKRLENFKLNYMAYQDYSKEDHKIYFYPYITGLWINSGGILTDTRDPIKIKLRDEILNSNLIIDIDLDYCTYHRDEKTFRISEENFNWCFNNDHFINLIKNEATLVSITLEPVYCSSNSRKILDMFINYFKSIELFPPESTIEELLNKIDKLL